MLDARSVAHARAPMNLQPRPAKPRRANESRDLTRPIEAALNKLPGVRIARNNTGLLRDARGVPVRFGLGTGSADLVGIVSVTVDEHHVTGRAFCLECKLPGREKLGDKERLADQARWARVVRNLGGFCCVVTSIADAVAAVGRCRAGLSE